MKVTVVLCKQHIGRMIRHLWKLKSKIEPIDCGAEAELAPFGIPISDPKDVLTSRLNNITRVHIDVVGYKDKPVVRDESHSLYHKQECHMYTNADVLVKGLDQAKLITNTVEIQEDLPVALTRTVCGSADRADLVKKCVMSSHIFETEQEKLPRYIDSNRPYHHHARIYGITDRRKADLLMLRLTQLCGSLCGMSQFFVKGGPVRVNLNKDGQLLQLSVRADMLFMAKQPSSSFASVDEAKGMALPILGPVHPLISIETNNFYDELDVYPAGNKLYPHMLVLHSNVSEVHNLYGTPVTEKQWLGRSLLNTFAVAAAYARHCYGADVLDLPEPVVLPCCHTDGRLFHFSALQLNTLNLDSSSSHRNIFWSTPRKALYDFCGYDSARPQLVGYNPEVFEMLLSFYSHGIKHQADNDLAV